MSAPSATERSTRRRAFLGSSVGNAIEWYDFAAYGFVAAYIGKVFFPTGSPTAQLLSTFAVFGLSFVARPLGGLVLGPLADKIGRQRVMVVVVTMMAGATFAIGVLPGYDAIGIAAPILLLVARLLQGFSAGGELGSTTAFIREHAAPGRRGFGVSWMPFGCIAGIMLGGVLVTTLGATLSAEAMLAWGWRVPFLFAGVLGLIGLYIRTKLDDAPEFREVQQRADAADRTPLREVLREHGPALAKVAGIAVLYAVSFWMVFTYLVTYISVVVGLGSPVALLAVLCGGVVALVVLPIAGSVSDRVGRRPVLLFGAIALLVVSAPGFMLIGSGSTTGAIVGTVVLAGLQASYLSTVMVTMVELFPTGVRTTGVGVGVNLATAVFGGMAPFAATLLISASGITWSPSWYVMAAAIVSLVAVLAIRRGDLQGENERPAPARVDADQPALDGVGSG